MAYTHPEKKSVFTTPWFRVLSADTGAKDGPHYVIQSPDFVVIVALTRDKQLLLVRQYRQAVEEVTLELPAGHIDPGETPEQAARKELLEETGYAAEKFELLARISPSTARFTNRMWCYFATDAAPSPDAALVREAGLELVLYDGSLAALLDDPAFYSAGACSALFAAIVRGRFPFSPSSPGLAS